MVLLKCHYYFEIKQNFKFWHFGMNQSCFCMYFLNNHVFTFWSWYFRVFEKIEEKLKGIGANTKGLKRWMGGWAKGIALRGNQNREQGYVFSLLPNLTKLSKYKLKLWEITRGISLFEKAIDFCFNNILKIVKMY